MKLLKNILFLLLLFILGYPNPLLAEPPEERISRTEYIETYKEIAIREMNAYHIPASIILAQGILESGNGNSRLAKIANNHFGIKCHKGWNKGTFYMDDDEKNECFRKYKDPETSYIDHSLFLTSRDRYAFLFDLKISDYKAWSKGLKQAGYATNPRYPQLLIKIIEDNELYKYDDYYGKKYSGSQKKVKPTSNYNKPKKQKEYKQVPNQENNRKVYMNNGLKFIYAKKGDSFYSIAKDFNIYVYQVYRNNDMTKKDAINDGQMLYLEPKKSTCTTSMHIAKSGESLFDISQEYGIKLKKLAKYNMLKKDAILYPDQSIKLKK